MKVLITCACGSEFETTEARQKDGRGKFCSKTCQYANATRPSGLKYQKHKENPTSFKKGHTPWHKGLMIKEWDRYGVDPSYRHKLIRKMYGRPSECEHCDSHKNLQWSNVSGKYKEEREDWQQLCSKCHQKYDYETFGARLAFYE